MRKSITTGLLAALIIFTPFYVGYNLGQNSRDSVDKVFHINPNGGCTLLPCHITITGFGDDLMGSRYSDSGTATGTVTDNWCSASCLPGFKSTAKSDFSSKLTKREQARCQAVEDGRSGDPWHMINGSTEDEALFNFCFYGTRSKAAANLLPWFPPAMKK